MGRKIRKRVLTPREAAKAGARSQRETADDRRAASPRLQAGIPLGGIGAGSVEIRDDGLFSEWQITDNWRPDVMHARFDDAFFAVRIDTEDGLFSRVLATEPRAGLEPVRRIDYRGRFPYAELHYDMARSPCIVRLTASSVFIPHDSKNSGLPLAVFRFWVVNTGRSACDVSIAFCLPQVNGGSSVAAVAGRGWRGVEVGDGSLEGSAIAAAMSGAAAAGSASSAAALVRSLVATGGVEMGAAESDTGAVCDRVTLAPGEKRSFTFFLAWHFPRFIDAEGIDIGRRYAGEFASAKEVAVYAAKHLRALELRTRQFVDVFYRSSLPEWLIDAVNSQFTTLFKSAWWTRDGTFAIWEGLSCCGTQTADVAYYGSFGLLALFPELAKQAMRLSARFQNPSGRIPHFFPGTFQYPDAYHMIDLMPKFTLMVWRDYIWTGDRGYLDEMWPHVLAAMEHNRALDRNGDFLPDDIGIDQTYDGWEFEGASIYVGLINTAACQAVARMARLQDDEQVAVRYERLADLGAASLERLLWNGRYYDLFYDISTGRRDRCCMADAMNGQWYGRMLELGDLLDPERVKSAMRSVCKFNRTRDSIRNGTWPPGGEPSTGGQWSAVWSGTEYMLASHLIYEGMVDEGLAVAKQVYDRHAAEGRTWKHSECGDHYYRAMSVLTLLYAAQGFAYSAVEKRLRIDPRLQRQKHRSPLVLPGCWGEIEFEETAAALRLRIEILSGELPLSRIGPVSGAAESLGASMNEEPLPARLEQLDGGVMAVLGGETTLGPGQVLEIVIGR